MFEFLVIAVAAYFLGALPTGYWLGLAYGKDLTKLGSGSTGATNVMRNIGKWQAALILALDALKGFAPVYFARNFTEMNLWLVLIITIIPLIGHSKSIFIGFRGGKSSATGFGVLLALNWVVALITISTWAATVFFSKYSSLGSIVCIPLLPVWLWIFSEPLPVISFGLFATVYIVLIKHRSNIKRLLDGTEPKIS